MLASDVIAGADDALNDEDHVTWELPDLLAYITSACRQVAILRPDACAQVVPVQLAAGTKQDLPVTGRRLLDITRNLGSDGTTPGKPITAVDRKSLDLLNLYWHSGTGKTEIQHFTYDERTPQVFYVFPPVHDTTAVYVEAALATTPADITDVNDVLPLDDIYFNAVLEWVLYRAFSVETDSASSQQEASKHHNAFYESLGMKLKTDVGFSPSREVKQND